MIVDPKGLVYVLMMLVNDGSGDLAVPIVLKQIEMQLQLEVGMLSATSP